MPDQTGVPAATVDRTLADTDTALGGFNRAMLQHLNNAATLDNMYDFAMMLEGKPTASQKVGLYRFARARILRTTPVANAHSLGADIAATGSTVFDVQKNGVSIGSITFAAAGATATLSLGASPVSFAVHDKLSVIAPATADATLADIAFTLILEGA